MHRKSGINDATDRLRFLNLRQYITRLLYSYTRRNKKIPTKELQV